MWAWEGGSDSPTSRQGSSRWRGKGFSAPSDWAVSCPSVEERERRTSGASDLTDVGPGIQQLLCRRGKSSLLPLRPSSSFLQPPRSLARWRGPLPTTQTAGLMRDGGPLLASPSPTHCLPHRARSPRSWGCTRMGGKKSVGSR